MAWVVYCFPGVRTAVVYHTGALGDLIVAVPAIEHWAADRCVERLVLLGRGHPGELLQAAGIVGDQWDAGAAWFARAYRGAAPSLPAPVAEALAFTEPGGPIDRALAAAVSGPVSVVRPVPARREPIVRHHLRRSAPRPRTIARRRFSFLPGRGSAASASHPAPAALARTGRWTDSPPPRMRSARARR